LNGGSLDEIARGLVDALISAKWKRLDVARAMHEPLIDIRGADLVRAATKRGACLTASLLAKCRDATFDAPESLGLFIMSACSSLLQAAIRDPARVDADAVELRANMYAMVRGYLKEMSQAGQETRGTQN
jgi:hypothetical protein